MFITNIPILNGIYAVFYFILLSFIVFPMSSYFLCLLLKTIIKL